MDVESIITKLENQKDELTQYAVELQTALEYYDKESLSLKEKRRKAKIEKELERVKALNEENDNDLNGVTTLKEKIEELENIYNETKDPGAKYLVGKDLDEFESEFKTVISSLEAKEFELTKIELPENIQEVETEEVDLDEMEEERKAKPSKKQIAVGSVAGLIAAVAMLAAIKGCGSSKTQKPNPNSTPSTSVSDSLDSSAKPEVTSAPESSHAPTPEVTEEVVIKTFTDITNEEQVAERAEEIKGYFDKYVPAYPITIEEIENMLRFINGGYVESATLDDAANVIDTINVAMVSELGNATDRANEVETTREEQKDTFDYGLFFLDGTKAQMLADKITDLRASMILNAGTDITEYRKEFATLMNNAWMLHGNSGKEIDAYSLETSGMEAVIDLMFLNTAALMGESDDIVITDALLNEDKTFTQILNEANYEDCPTQVVDEDGTVYDITLDKSTSDLVGMVTEAAYNQTLYESAKLTLK